MTELSNKICRIEGVLGASVIDRDGAIVDNAYVSESAKAMLESMAPAILETVRRCELHDPDLQHLRLRFHDLTLFTKIYKRERIITLCKSDLIVYLLDSSIASLVAEHEKSKAPPNNPVEAEVPNPSYTAATSTPPVSSVSAVFSGGHVEETTPDRLSLVPMSSSIQERLVETSTPDNRRVEVNLLYGKILTLMRPYFSDAAAAERLLPRQIRDRLKISVEQLNARHMEKLAEWVTTAAGLLIDKSRAAEIGNKIRNLQ